MPPDPHTASTGGARAARDTAGAAVGHKPVSRTSVRGGNGDARFALIRQVAVIGINHVALDVGSVAEALDFWRALFPELRLRNRSQTMAFIDLGDQFVALFEHQVEPRSESIAFRARRRRRRCRCRCCPRAGRGRPRQQRRRSMGNRFDVVALQRGPVHEGRACSASAEAADPRRATRRWRSCARKGSTSSSTASGVRLGGSSAVR